MIKDATALSDKEGTDRWLHRYLSPRRFSQNAVATSIVYLWLPLHQAKKGKKAK